MNKLRSERTERMDEKTEACKCQCIACIRHSVLFME